jgi:hypothetical protein
LNWNVDADDNRLLDYELSNHCAARFRQCAVDPERRSAAPAAFAFIMDG